MSDTDSQTLPEEQGSKIQKSSSSISFVEKPPTLRSICSVDTGLPVIIKPSKSGAKNICTFERTRRSVKKNVTLPKLKKENRKQAEAGEPNRFHSDCAHKVSSSSILSEQDFILRSHSDISRGEREAQKELEICVSERKIEELMKKYINEDEEGSRALKRWEYWMNDKKTVQNYLSKKINRPPYHLRLQESDKYREVVEKKLLHTLIPKIDKFEKSSVELEKVKKSQRKSTKEVRYGKAEIEYIRIPEGIKAEKGIIEPQPENQDADLVGPRKKKASDKEVSMQEDEGLMVVGKNIYEVKGETKCSSLPKIPAIVTSEYDVKEMPSSCSEVHASIFCLVINGYEIKYEIGVPSCQCESRNSLRNLVWEVDFGTQSVRCTTERSLRFENRSTMAIKYEWIPANTEQKKYFGILELKYREPCFFFNKNSGFLLPGQIYEFKIYFHPKSCGIRRETWYLKTNPPLSENQDFAEINMIALATEEVSDTGVYLDCYLKRRAKESLVLYIIEILLRKVFLNTENLRGIEYRSILCRKSVFEYQNPNYYYHPSVVPELYDIFEMIPDKHQKEWDLSIGTLIQLSKNYTNKEERNDCLIKISQIQQRLLRPTCSSYTKRKKSKSYKMIYRILCKMFNLMEEDYIYLRSLVSEEQEPTLRGNVFDEDTETGWQQEYGEYGEMYLPRAALKPINILFFRTMFCIKVYHRICEAVECLVGTLETAKLFEPWKRENKKPPKPEKCKNYWNRK